MVRIIIDDDSEQNRGKLIKCPDCQGTSKHCPECKGTGTSYRTALFGVPCRTCGGTGDCKKCSGTGYLRV